MKRLAAKIKTAGFEELAALALSMMRGTALAYKGRPVICTFDDVRGIFEEHRPSLDWSEFAAFFIEYEERGQ